MVHLSLFVGKLARAESGGFVHHIRRLVFQVAGVGVALQEVADQRPLDTRALALIDGESGSGELYAQVEVYDIQVLDKFPVGQGLLAEFRHRAAHFDHHVVFRGAAFGHVGAGQVGQQHHQVVLRLLALGHLLVQLAGFFLQRSHGGFGGLRLVTLAGLHQASDLGGLRFLFGKAVVQFTLKGTAGLVDIDNLVNNLPCIEMLDGEPFNHELRLLSENLEC